jgi:hypothetical protein
MALISRECRLEFSGEESEETLHSTAILAAAYSLEGRWDKGEQLQLQVMGIRKTKLGAGHIDTLTTMTDLASTYMEQGRLEEAETLFLHVMELSKTKLGADHPDILMTLGNLALAYRS